MDESRNIHVCVPVVNRYDLLRDMLVSIQKGTVQPIVHIVHNGRDSESLHSAIDDLNVYEVFTPAVPMGVAETWNWFLKNVEEPRLICNDDLIFGRDSLQILRDTPGDLVSGTEPAFSCFRIDDSCVIKVGRFDETISPGYVYFEDCDYIERMDVLNVELVKVQCGVIHLGSQTLSARTGSDLDEHHRKFDIAKTNFINKWGRLPKGVA